MYIHQRWSDVYTAYEEEDTCMPYSVYGIYGAYIFDELKTLVSTYIRRIYIYIHQRWSDAYTAYTPYIYKHWSDVYAAYTEIGRAHV